MVALAASAAERKSESPVPKAPTADASTIRHTQYGDIIGFIGPHDTNTWLGIPFARPPIGSLRWRAPLPPEKWQGTREALTIGSQCPQADGEALLAQHGKAIKSAEYLQRTSYSGNEDCLFLNIRTPRASKKALPVMFYIHGGANISGNGGTLDTSVLAATQEVVVVTINYRLGLFGFFSHPALRAGAGSAEDHSGNYALLDQISALQWVRDNIAAFGGDPGNVTIFGVSAGGMDCMALLSSPLAAGLFHRAIPMSGLATTRSREEAENYTDTGIRGLPVSSGELLLQLLIQDGKASDRSAALRWVSSSQPAAIAAYLRSKSFADFDRAYSIVSDDKPSVTAAILVRDGKVIPLEGIPASYSKKNGHNRVPVMIGTTKDEDQPYVLTESRYADLVSGPEGFEYHFKDLKGYRLMSEYMSLLWNAEAADELATALSSDQSGQIFGYRLDWDEVQPWPGPDREPRGAVHSQDIPLVFGFPPVTEMNSMNYRFVPPATKAGVAGYEEVSKAMMSYWAQFAYTGNPGKGRHGELPQWQPWSNASNGPKFMMLNSKAGGGLRMATQSLTKAAVLERLARDPRLPTDQDRCDLLAQMVNYHISIRRVVPDDYAAYRGGICARQFPMKGVLQRNP